MKTVMTAAARPLAQGSFARVLAGPFGKHIALEKEDGTGGGAGDDEAAKAAAAAAAAKEAADKAVKDEADVEAAEKAKKDGISDADAKLLKELMEIKNTNKDLKGKATEAENLKKELEGLGGLEALKALVSAQKDAEKKALEAKGEFETVKKMIVEENQKKVAEALEQANAVKTELDSAKKTIDDLTIGAAFSASSVVGDLVISPTKARLIYDEYVEREDGKIVVYDKKRGVSGRAKITGADGEAVSFDIGIKKLIDADPDRDRLLKSKMQAGAGSQTSNEKSKDKEVALTGSSRIAAALAARKK